MDFRFWQTIQKKLFENRYSTSTSACNSMGMCLCLIQGTPSTLTCETEEVNMFLSPLLKENVDLDLFNSSEYINNNSQINSQLITIIPILSPFPRKPALPFCGQEASGHIHLWVLPDNWEALTTKDWVLSESSKTKKHTLLQHYCNDRTKFACWYSSATLQFSHFNSGFYSSLQDFPRNVAKKVLGFFNTCITTVNSPCLST